MEVVVTGSLFKEGFLFIVLEADGAAGVGFYLVEVFGLLPKLNPSTKFIFLQYFFVLRQFGLVGILNLRRRLEHPHLQLNYWLGCFGHRRRSTTL
jgi:hypothetical protein